MQIEEYGTIEDLVFSVRETAGTFRWQVFDKVSKFYEKGGSETLKEAKRNAESAVGQIPEWRTGELVQE